MRGVGPQSATNDNNGYLIKSAQNSVNKQHAHHHQAFPGKMHSQYAQNHNGPVPAQRDIYSGKSGIQGAGRERGLSASAIDQNRVSSQIRNKTDQARNYSVGVHKKMHGNSSTHPSQSNIGSSQ